MSIKQQLSKFYDKQGLTGKHRRKAMQWDMKAARHNDNSVACNGARGYATYLMAAFVWANTPEGVDYWSARNI